MAVTWPDWAKVENLVKKKDYVAGNTEFNTFKKAVVKSSIDEIDALVEYAPVMWDFLLGFAAIKNLYRNLILQVINKLTQVPSWVAAFENGTGLHEKMKTLHEDLQAALGAQHEVIMRSIAPGALKSIALVPKNEQPQNIRHALQKEQLLDAIREETQGAFGGGEQEAASPIQNKPLAALQEGIDAVVAIDDNAKMVSGGRDALNLLRIGCIQSAGYEDSFQHEISHACQVFSFILSFTKRSPGAVNAVAEVASVLMASPSWSAVFEASPMLQGSLRELPEDAQAALGLAHEKLMHFVSGGAKAKAQGGKVPEAVKGVAERMQSISRLAPSAQAGEALRAAIAKAAEPEVPPPPPPKDEWKEAKTPEGHTYYFNLQTKQSTWERPAALGGPHVYKVGDEVEVWSNSSRIWGRGKVEKVEGGNVTAEFALPNGGVAKKELPATHKDLRPARPAAPSETAGWSPEEREAYTRWFGLIPGDGTLKSGVAVADFLRTSQLERPVLKQVWAVANPGSKGELGFDEFACCCRLVAHCQAMLDLPVVKEADRALRVKLREECARMKPPALPKFNR